MEDSMWSSDSVSPFELSIESCREHSGVSMDVKIVCWILRSMSIGGCETFIADQRLGSRQLSLRQFVYIIVISMLLSHVTCHTRVTSKCTLSTSQIISNNWVAFCSNDWTSVLRFFFWLFLSKRIQHCQDFGDSLWNSIQANKTNNSWNLLPTKCRVGNSRRGKTMADVKSEFEFLKHLGQWQMKIWSLSFSSASSTCVQLQLQLTLMTTANTARNMIWAMDWWEYNSSKTCSNIIAKETV